ncbi:cell division protein FtsL [Acidobacteriota bacterium]
MIRKKFSKKEVTLGIACAVIVTFILSFYIWHQMESIRLGYQARELEFKIESLKQEIEKLETTQARYLSLERVERIALNELKLNPPREDQIIHMNGRSISGEEKKASK